jgi:hypothetical protein
VDLSHIINPYVTSGVIAAIVGIALVWLAWSSRSELAGFVSRLRTKLFSRAGFFWSVNIIFMAVSVLHAGVFFGITGNGHDIPGIAQYLGFAVSFFLDLVTIILMQALLEAKYRSDEQKARQLLLFIAICCATSTFANLAISLNDFNAAKELPSAPLWIQIAAPYVLASFPLFVILMSIAAEMIVNVRPLDSLNAEEYEADEQKRIALLRIRNDYLQRQSDEEMRTLQIRNQMKMNKQMNRQKFSLRPAKNASLIAQLEAMRQEIEMLKKESHESTPEEQSDTVIVDKMADSIDVFPAPIPVTPVADIPLPKVTVKLPSPDEYVAGQQSKRERTTDELLLVDKRRTQSGDTAKRKKVERVLRKNPEISSTLLADRAGVSRSYAGQIKKEFEQTI